MGEDKLTDGFPLPEKISELMFRRLLAWKHVCGHLENYINATHKAQRTLAKEFEKVLKVGPSLPLLVE